MQSHRIIAAAAALALAAVPAATAKKPESPGAQGKAKAEQHKGKGKAKAKAKNIVVHGTIAKIEGDVVTIAVKKANRHGRGLTELAITVTKVSVADVNGDGSSTVADFAVNDSVVAHSKGGKLISVTHPETDEDETPAPAPAPAPAPTA